MYYVLASNNIRAWCHSDLHKGLLANVVFTIPGGGRATCSFRVICLACHSGGENLGHESATRYSYTAVRPRGWYNGGNRGWKNQVSCSPLPYRCRSLRGKARDSGVRKAGVVCWLHIAQPLRKSSSTSASFISLADEGLSFLN